MSAEGVLLFTGFPGFLGAQLLPRLLELRPEWRAACLVQPRFSDAARAALERLERHAPGVRGRIELVSGDITEAGLGIESGARDRLRSETVAAFHLAAAYDLAVSREVGERVNVGGTREVLRFAEAAPRFERLHYVSTAYVAGTSRGVFLESELDRGQGFRNHYEATKFLAEVAVVESGLPASTYRPGIVVGDSRSGETAKFDGPYFVLRAMERLPSPGLFLRVGSGRHPANLVPVDYVIEGMARLAAGERRVSATFHLTDPESPETNEVAGLLAGALGRRFWFVPLPGFAARALLAPPPIQRWLGMPVQSLAYFEHQCRFDSAVARAALEPLGVRCPRFADYVATMVAFYRAHRDGVRSEAMV